MRTASSSIRTSSDLAVNIASFRRHLHAENLSPKTQETYTESVHQLHQCLVERGMPLDTSAIWREHLESWIEYLLKRRQASTANNRYRGILAIFKWAGDEGEVKGSPMTHMKPPKVPDNPPEILREEQIRTLVGVGDRDTFFEGRRDAALIRVFVDTGARLQEVTELHFNPEEAAQNDVDLDLGVIRVVGKGRRDGW